VTITIDERGEVQIGALFSTRRDAARVFATGPRRAGRGSDGRRDEGTAIPLSQKSTQGLLCEGSAVVFPNIFADSPVDVAVVEIFLEKRVAIRHPDEVTPRA
jgi:hypothetical protein